MTQQLSLVESIKQNADLYGARKVLNQLAGKSVDDITPEEDIILRWHGLYRQYPRDDGFFMLRLKLPGGTITADQLSVVARIAEQVGKGVVDLTTRQGIEFHWLALSDLVNVFAELDAVGLTTVGACGDVIRNVIGCPVSGIDADELLDTTPEIQALTAAFLGNLGFANLPRKLKIAVSGCAHRCIPVEVNDVALTAAPGPDGKPGYALSVGGGLSAQPMLASNLGVWLARNEVVDVVTHIAQIFLENGNRENRKRARLKYVLADWGPARFREELENRLSRKLTKLADYPMTSSLRGDHLGVCLQHDSRFRYIGIPVPTGRLTVRQLNLLAELALTHGQKRLRVTHHQNIVLPDIPAEKVDKVLTLLDGNGLVVNPGGWQGTLITCAGRDLCNQALAHTRHLAEQLVNILETDLPGQAVSLRISGCLHGCGQHAIADIGLQGTAAKGEDGVEERFDLWIGGGASGTTPVIGRKWRRRLKTEELPSAIRDLLTRYRKESKPGETFSAFANRVLVDAELVNVC